MGEEGGVEIEDDARNEGDSRRPVWGGGEGKVAGRRRREEQLRVGAGKR